MKKISDKGVAYGYMYEWAKCEDKDIEACFQRFNNGGDVTHAGQFERLYGIDFGEAGKEFYSFVQGMRDKSSLAMSLGVQDKFKVMFETSDGKDQSFYESDQENDGLMFHSHEAAPVGTVEPVRKRYGILPVVRDHLCVNWFGLLPSDIHEKFLAMEPTQKIDNLAEKYEGAQISSSTLKKIISELSDPFNRVAVRAKKYPVTGYNLEVLKKILLPESKISVSFGIVPADFYYNDDLFTIILEIDNRNVDKGRITEDGDGGTTNLDFVGACPPACPDGGG